jgi:hypothetical protein
VILLPTLAIVALIMVPKACQSAPSSKGC